MMLRKAQSNQYSKEPCQGHLPTETAPGEQTFDGAPTAGMGRLLSQAVDFIGQSINTDGDPKEHHGVAYEQTDCPLHPPVLRHCGANRLSTSAIPRA
jgi:hypothetical protein